MICHCCLYNLYLLCQIAQQLIKKKKIYCRFEHVIGYVQYNVLNTNL